MANPTPIIYSQHLRCLARLLKNPTLYSVFTFLFDEYLLQVRKGQDSPSVKFNQSQIANNSGVDRGALSKYIIKLEELGLITLKGRQCEIHSDYLLAISQLYYQTSDNETRELICDAFRAGQRNKLEELGLEYKENANTVFSGLFGGLSENLQFHGNCSESVENSTVSNKSVEFSTVSDKSVENSTLSEKVSKILHFEDNMAKSVENSTVCTSKVSNFLHFSDQIREIYHSKEELKEAILSQKCRNFYSFDIDEYVDFIFDGDNAENCRNFDTFAKFTFDFCLAELSKFRHKSVENSTVCPSKSVEISTPEINIINKKINNNESEPEFEPEEEVFEGFDSFKVIDLIKPDEEISQEDLRKGQEPVYPFLPVEQVEEIVNNIEVAKQSSFRLFLFNLWGYASDMTNEGYDQFADEEDEQETFSETEEEFFDPEGCLITRSDYRQLLLESYEQTQADIEKGEMEYGEETLSLSLTEMFPRNLLFKILDWKETAMSCKESSVIISKAGIRNIEAEELSSVEQPQTREEKRQAAKEGRELMVQLHAAKQDNNLYSQLTPIEKIAADIVEDYFQPNPDKESRDPFVFRSRNILTKDEWRALKFQMVKMGVKVTEFLSCLLNNDGPNDGDQLSLQMPMFYAEGIRHWNEVHQETSVL